MHGVIDIGADLHVGNAFPGRHKGGSVEMLRVQSVWMFLRQVRAVAWKGTEEGFRDVMVPMTALISVWILWGGRGQRR